MVTSGTVMVFFAGMGSCTAGVAVPDGAADRMAGVAPLEGVGAGTSTSTSYDGSEVFKRGAVKMAV